MDSCVSSAIPRLSFLCHRTIAIRLFHCNIRTQTLREAETFGPQPHGWLRDVRMPPRLRRELEASLLQAIQAVQRWADKHAQLFPRSLLTRRRVHRSQHFCLYYHRFVWHPTKIDLQQVATAKEIIVECADWPMMQFQFACAYAFDDLLSNVGSESGHFDTVHVRAFKVRLHQQQHPLYDFWFEYMRGREAAEALFNGDGWAPNQTVSLAFQWSLVNGFQRLAEFLWMRVTEAQREFSGLLQWRRVCFQAKHWEVVEFLCRELCEINRVGLARITWNIFYGSLARFLSDLKDETTSAEGSAKCQEQSKDTHLRRLKFLLEHCCPKLKRTLLTTDNYRSLTDVYKYQDDEAFALFLTHMNPDQLQEACDFFDSIYANKPTDQLRDFRTILRRQRTIT